MEQPNYYAVIPANVRYDKQLKDKAKLLYGEISALASKSGACYASNRYFADLYGVSTKTIISLINNLVERGYISKEIIYKENTKEIDKRYLQIFHEDSENNFMRGSEENFTDNNTSINNTRINISPIVPLESFEKFWKIYPKKQDKQKTIKWFNKHQPNEELLKTILEKVELFKQTKQWQNKQYIPMPTTWLNGERWNDEIAESDLTEKQTSREEILEQARKELREEGYDV